MFHVHEPHSQPNLSTKQAVDASTEKVKGRSGALGRGQLPPLLSAAPVRPRMVRLPSRGGRAAWLPEVLLTRSSDGPRRVAERQVGEGGMLKKRPF